MFDDSEISAIVYQAVQHALQAWQQNLTTICRVDIADNKVVTIMKKYRCLEETGQDIQSHRGLVFRFLLQAMAKIYLVCCCPLVKRFDAQTVVYTHISRTDW